MVVRGDGTGVVETVHLCRSVPPLPLPLRLVSRRVLVGPVPWSVRVPVRRTVVVVQRGLLPNEGRYRQLLLRWLVPPLLSGVLVRRVVLEDEVRRIGFQFDVTVVPWTILTVKYWFPVRWVVSVSPCVSVLSTPHRIFCFHSPCLNLTKEQYGR